MRECARGAESLPRPYETAVAALHAIKVTRRGEWTAGSASRRGGPRRGAFGNKAKPNSPPRRMLVVVGYRMGAITSFPFGEPVLSSSTIAEIASDSGAIRPIAGTSWPCSAASAMPAKDCDVGLPNTR